MANPHDLAPVIGCVGDRSGLWDGWVAAAGYSAAGRSEAWYLVRLAGRVGDYRAVPASAVQWAWARSEGRRLFPGWTAATHRGAMLRLSVDLARPRGRSCPAGRRRGALTPRAGLGFDRSEADAGGRGQSPAARCAGVRNATARVRPDRGHAVHAHLHPLAATIGAACLLGAATATRSATFSVTVQPVVRATYWGQFGSAFHTGQPLHDIGAAAVVPLVYVVVFSGAAWLKFRHAGITT